MSGVTDCHWCFALVSNEVAQRHSAWHQIHDLHAPDCKWQQRKANQHTTDMYLPVQPCTCGLSSWVPSGEAAFGG